jgi:hypothetical protein
MPCLIFEGMGLETQFDATTARSCHWIPAVSASVWSVRDFGSATLQIEAGLPPVEAKGMPKVNSARLRQFRSTG